MQNAGRGDLSNAETPDASLIGRAVAGDDGAFRAIVLRYQGVVARTVRGMLGPAPEVDDVCQEVFIRLHRGLAGFRGDASLKTYLTRIAINLSLNALEERKSRRGRFVVTDDVDTAHAARAPAADEAEHAEVVRAALGRLDPKHRAVVVLRMLDGCSTKETAATLDIPHGTVLSRLSRGMKMLETLLKPYMDEL